MDRKECANCGETSLAQDPICWACGSRRFLGVGISPQSDRTVALDADLHRTHGWEDDRRPWFALLWVGAGMLFALFLGGVGFWLGRASTPVAAIPAPAVAPPVSLPAPPTALQSGFPPVTPPPSTWRLPVPDPDPTPPVSVRTQRGSGLPGSAAAPNMAPSNSALPPPGAVARYPAPPQVIASPLAPPAVQPRLPVATPTTVVVGLRNDTDAPITVVFDGPDSRTATVAPRGLLPVTLPPGGYQIRVSGGGEPARCNTTLAGGRTYSLTVDSRRDEGRQMLVVTEPAMEGT